MNPDIIANGEAKPKNNTQIIEKIKNKKINKKSFLSLKSNKISLLSLI
jgi:hypothetical protein